MLLWENLVRRWRLYELVEDGELSGMYRMRVRMLHYWDGQTGEAKSERVWEVKRLTAAPGGRHLVARTLWFPASQNLRPGEAVADAYRRLGFFEGLRRRWSHREATREVARNEEENARRYGFRLR